MRSSDRQHAVRTREAISAATATRAERQQLGRVTRQQVHPASLPRPGFTLLEMLLVLAILVAITAVTIPVVERMYDLHRIQQAALEVRTALSIARLRAVDGGEAWECRFEPDGRHLVILAPHDGRIRFGSEGERAPAARQRPLEPIHVELPEPLYFWTADDARQRLAVQAANQRFVGISLVERTWSAPVVFAPNGSSTNAKFEIRDHAGRAVQLEVRGLTGAASSSTRVRRSVQ